MKKNLFFILLTSCTYLKGQEISNIYISDFDYFIKKLIETHPDPYSGFGNQIEFYRAKQELRDEIKNVSGNDEFATKLNGFISRLKDGHTIVNKPQGNNNDEPKRLPLELKASSNYLFVQNSTTDFKEFIGKPIIAINNVPIEHLLEKIKLLYPSENISGAYFNLIKVLSQDKSAKELLGTSDKSEFTFSFPEGKRIGIIPFQTDVSFLSNKSMIEIPFDNGLLNWTMIGNKKDIGYFVWNSILSREIVEQIYRDAPKYLESNLIWAYSFLKVQRTGDIKQDIKQIPSLYEQFSQLLHEMKTKGSKYLIIDLRNNGGGMTSLVKPLLYMLYGDNYLNFDFNVEYTSKISPLYLNKMGFKSIEDYNNANNSNYQIGDYRFSTFVEFDRNLSLSKKREMIKNGYSGFGAEYINKSIADSTFKPEIIVLTSPNTFSAAYHFTYFLKRLGNTTIIGVASKQAGNTFMETTLFELPNTKLQGSISNSKQVFFKDNPILGEILRPDYEMNWDNFNNYKFDKNAEVLKAVELIENKKIGVR